MEKTLALIKPDAVKRGLSGAIISLVEQNGFKVVAMKLVKFTPAMAQQFYAVHKERPFFGELVDMITESPVVAMILESDNALANWRALMGTTDPSKSPVGTVRKMFGLSIGQNSVHGSDSQESFVNESTVVFGGNCC